MPGLSGGSNPNGGVPNGCANHYITAPLRPDIIYHVNIPSYIVVTLFVPGGGSVPEGPLVSV